MRTRPPRWGSRHCWRCGKRWPTCAICRWWPFPRMGSSPGPGGRRGSAGRRRPGWMRWGPFPTTSPTGRTGTARCGWPWTSPSSTVARWISTVMSPMIQRAGTWRPCVDRCSSAGSNPRSSPATAPRCTPTRTTMQPRSLTSWWRVACRWWPIPWTTWCSRADTMATPGGEASPGCRSCSRQAQGWAAATTRSRTPGTPWDAGACWKPPACWCTWPR